MKKLIIYFIALCICNSCYRNGEKCEAFNFSRLPVNKLYFDNQLKYSNGNDTIILYTDGYYTKASRLNPMANPICNPSFEINYSANTHNILNFLYSFSYYPESDITNFQIWVNQDMILLDMDSISKHRFEQKEEQKFTNFSKEKEVDSSRAIKSIVLKGLRINEVEKLNGEKWVLVKE